MDGSIALQRAVLALSESPEAWLRQVLDAPWGRIARYLRVLVGGLGASPAATGLRPAAPAA